MHGINHFREVFFFAFSFVSVVPVFYFFLENEKSPISANNKREGKIHAGCETQRTRETQEEPNLKKISKIVALTPRVPQAPIEGLVINCFSLTLRRCLVGYGNLPS
mgnify:CR=1 FL=1